MELQYWAKDKWWLQDEYSRLFAYHGVSQQEVEDCISRVMQVFTPEWQQAMATAPHPAFLALLPQGTLPLQYLFNLGRNLRTVAGCLRVQQMIRELRLPASYESAYLELQIAAHLKEQGHEVEFSPKLANGKESDLLAIYGCQRTHLEIKRMETSQHQKALDALGNEVWFAVDVVGFASQYPHLAGKGFRIDLHQSLSDLLTGPDNDRSTIRSIVQTIVTEIGKRSESEQEFEIPSIATVVVMEGRVEGCGINWPMASCQEELKRFIRTHLQNAISQLPPDHPGLIVAQMSGLLDEGLTTTIIHGWLKDSDAAHVSAVVFLPVYNPMPTPWALFKPFVVLNSQARFPANDLRAFADFAPVIDREITIPTAEAQRPHKDILIAIRAFLDGSGKLTDNYITLAAFAGNDEIWSKFETEWDRILSGHTPRAEYVHMRELVHQTKGFNRKLGWNPSNSFGLVFKCLMYMQHLDKQRFRMFYCAVDLAAWRKLKAETYQLPEPLELCNRFCSELVLGWYFVKHPDVLDPMSGAIHYFFDKDEPFKQTFADKWKSETSKIDAAKGEWTVWGLIKEVAAVDMKKVPGVQAADILAWSVNRDNTSGEGSPGKHLRHIMQQVIPSGFIVWDEAKLREHFKPLIHKP